MKKILTIIVAVALLLTGCAFAEVNKTGYPISDEVITVTIGGPIEGTYDFNGTVQVAEIKERLGIELKCTEFDSDEWKVKSTLMAVQGNMPDIVFNPEMTIADAKRYGETGKLLNLTPYLKEYAPNIVKYCDMYPEYLEYVFDDKTGGIYTLCQIDPNDINHVSRTWLNAKWLKNLGLEYPTTLDEFHDVLVAFKEQDANGNGDPNDEIPLSNLRGFGTLSNFMASFGILNYGHGDSCLFTADKYGTISLLDTTEEYKTFLKWLNQLWDEGLIDHEEYTQSEAEFNAKVAADRVGVFGGAAPFLANGKDISSDADYVWLGGLSSEYNKDRTVVRSNSVTLAPKFIVNAHTKNPEAVVRFLDYLFTTEGDLCGTYGYEDVTFTMLEGNMKGYGIVSMHQPEGYASAEEYRIKKAVINNGLNALKSFAGSQYDMIMDANEKELQELLPDYGWAVLVRQGLDKCKVVGGYPELTYGAIVNPDREYLMGMIGSYLDYAQMQFITGAFDADSDWNAFETQLEIMNVARLVEIEQEAYTALTGKEGFILDEEALAEQFADFQY